MSVHGYYDVTNIKMFQCTHVNLVMFRDLYLQGVLKNVLIYFASCFVLFTLLAAEYTNIIRLPLVIWKTICVVKVTLKMRTF